MTPPLRSPRGSAGHTLAELLLVLTLLGILLALAAPPLRATLQRLRVDAVARRLAADLHVARMLAVREGATVDVTLEARDGCVTRYLVGRRGGEAPPLVRTVAPELPGGCLRHSGAPRLSFDSRGLARSGGRTFVISAGAASDTLVVSFVGRVLRRR